MSPDPSTFDVDQYSDTDALLADRSGGGPLAWLRGVRALWSRRQAEWSAEDLRRRCVRAVLQQQQPDLSGAARFPPALQLRVEVRRGGPVEVVRGFAADPRFAAGVREAIRNALGRAIDVVPPLELVVVEGEQDQVTAVADSLDMPEQMVLEASPAGVEPGWPAQELTLPADQAHLLAGRGDWHGDTELVANDLRLPAVRWLPRALFELQRVGSRLELRPEPEARKLVEVWGAAGRVGADPTSGWIRLMPGDRIVIAGHEPGLSMELRLPGAPAPRRAHAHVRSGAMSPSGEEGRFAFTFEELARSRRGVRGWFSGNGSVVLDPLVVRTALERCLDRCSLRGPTGEALAWNVYVVHLSAAHRRTVELMVSRYGDALRHALDDVMQRRKMQAPEPPTILFELDARRLLDQDELVVEPGLWSPQRVHARAARAPQHTIRGRSRRTSVPVAPTPVVVQDASVPRSGFPPPPSGAELHVDGRTIPMEPRRRYVVGHGPGDGSDPHRICLDDDALARRHLVLRVFSDLVRIERLADAGPVEVNGEQVQAGGRFETDRFPVEIVAGGACLKLSRPRLSRSGA